MISEPLSVRNNVHGIAVLLLSGLIFLGLVAALHRVLWDDAFITFRFAQHLSNGEGLVWNPGSERVEGFTSLLHVVLLALGLKLGLQPDSFSVVVSTASVLTTMGILAAVVKRQLGWIPPASAGILGLYIVDSTTAIHSTTGLETQVFVLLLAAGYATALAMLDSPSQRNAFLLASTMFLAALARPEAVLFGAVLYVVLLCYFAKGSPAQTHRGLVTTFLSAGLLVVGGLLYAGWKFWYYGYLLPNPFYVKSGQASLDGLADVLPYVAHVLLWLGPLASLYLFLPRPRSDEPARRKWAIGLLTVGPPVVALGYYATIVHEVGGAFRFSYPTYFFIASGSALLIGTAALPKTNGLRRTLTAAPLAVLFFQGGILQGAAVGLRAQGTVPIPENPATRYHYRVAKVLLETGLGSRATIIENAAGIIPYVSGFNHVDPVGLTDNYLSGRRKTTFLERERYLWSRDADVFIGFQPPATDGATSPNHDPIMNTPYVAQSIVGRPVSGISRRVFVQDPEILHSRMRELRDRWYLLGEIESPLWSYMRLKTFAYVRKNSPHFGVLVERFRTIVVRAPDEIDFALPPLVTTNRSIAAQAILMLARTAVPIAP